MRTDSAPRHGLHHVTAIATDPRRNLGFYGDLLGLRLVKRTVNFDDPGTYHLYYGDHLGTPGTIMTFFPWPRARRGAMGAGTTHTTSFAIPEGSVGWWRDRLRAASVITGEVEERFDESALGLLDPDGMRLELVAAAGPEPAVERWTASPVPAQHAIRGFHGVTLLERSPEPTAQVLTELLDYAPAGSVGDRQRFSVGGTDAGRHVDLLIDDVGPGTVAAGTVHHVAFRAADDATQGALRERLVGWGAGVSPVMDRQYFRSIYFREPGGVLFEIATDPPGFGRDEGVAELGSALKLPPWLEGDRAQIEARLPELRPATGMSLPEGESS